jgi:hypothetical protein
MEILCERMVQQQLYSCASVLLAAENSTACDSSLFSNQTSFRFLLSRLEGHLASEVDLVGGSKQKPKWETAKRKNRSLLAGDWFASIETSEEMPSALP